MHSCVALNCPFRYAIAIVRRKCTSLITGVFIPLTLANHDALSMQKTHRSSSRCKTYGLDRIVVDPIVNRRDCLDRVVEIQPEESRVGNVSSTRVSFIFAGLKISLPEERIRMAKTGSTRSESPLAVARNVQTAQSYGVTARENN